MTGEMTDSKRPIAGQVASARTRTWMVFGMALGSALMFLSIWMVYAGTHTYPRYQQLPPGDTVTVDGITYKLIKLTSTEVVVDGSEQKPSQAGTSYVIAELEITIHSRKTFVGCDVTLVADGRRTWEPVTDFFSRPLPQYCGDEEHPIIPGKPWRFEQIFQIPLAFTGRLYGIAVDDPASPAPVKVLTF